jgi:hypothetical protein
MYPKIYPIYLSENQNAQTPGFTAMFAMALIAGAALVMQKRL